MQGHCERLDERSRGVVDLLRQQEDRLPENRPRDQHLLGKRAWRAVADVVLVRALAQL